MEFHSPTTLEDAMRLLSRDGARLLAGGQSLVAMMNLELASPACLVSLRRVPGLRGIESRADGSVRIGAMSTHAELAASDGPSPGLRVLAAAARVVAYPAVRNFGTVGGSIAHADPAADYPVALVAADARVELASTGGRREVPATGFFRGVFETAARPDEIVTAIIVPPGPAQGGAHFEKLSLVAGDFAIAQVAAIIAVADGRCSHAAIAVGAAGPHPVRVATADQALLGHPLDHGTIAAAADAVAAACNPGHDQRASAAYRRRVLPVLVARAIAAAARTGVPA